MNWLCWTVLTRENTCHRESICWQTVWRFQILQRQNFLHLSSLRVTKKYEKLLLSRVEQCFRAFKMLTVHKCCDSDLFIHLINHAASSILFHKYVSYESYLLFQNVQNLISSSEMQKKIQKILLVFKIISLNSLRWTVTFTEREYLSSGFNILRFQILPRQNFSTWSSFRVLRNMTKLRPWRFHNAFSPFNLLTVHRCSNTAHFSSHAFCRI